MSEWIYWDGGVCPVPGETPVRARYRNGVESMNEARAYRWDHTHKYMPAWERDIVAYQIIDFSASLASDPHPVLMASDKTLRDDIALTVLPSIFSDALPGLSFQAIAARTYELADAMLAERARSTPADTPEVSRG